jgi:hypothetical protein
MRLSISCMALALLAAAPLRGQASPRLEVGDRVRLETRDGVRIVGTVTSLGRDTIRLRGDRMGATATLPLASVHGYQIPDGRDRWRGARIGALVGAAAGAGLVALALHVDATADGDIMIPATFFAAPAALGLVLVGTGVGAAAAPERWTELAPLRVGGVRHPPAGPSVRLGFALRL